MTLKNPETFKENLEALLNQAKKLGADQAEVCLGQDQGFNVVVREQDVETIEYHADREAVITVYFGKRKGSATTTDIRQEALFTALNAACSIARFTEEDPCSGLADADLMATSFLDLDLEHPWSVAPKDAIEMALKCEAQGLAFDPRIIQSDGASISSFNTHFIYGNSHGFIGTNKSTLHEMSLSLIAKEKECMERDYSYTLARSASDLTSIEAIALEAGKKTIARLNPKKLSTMKAPVLFSAEIARSLIGNFMSAISGGSLYRKASFLLDHLGKPVFNRHVHIYEQPFLKKALGSSAFDSEGVATHAKDFIKDGLLESYLLSSYSARKLGLQTTGNADGAHNLTVDHHNLSLAALLKKMDRGIFLTELMGQGANLVTGDYSRGATGFWVENGEIQYPIAEITIAGNLRDMFLNLVNIANDVDHRSNILTGSILLEEMMIAGS